MTGLLVVCALLTAALGAFALGHYAATAAFLLGKPAARAFPETPEDAVTVLVPARNEGERALRVIRSLLAQDHRGRVEVVLLVRDAGDTSIPTFRAAYPGVDFDRPTGARIELSRSPDRVAWLVYAGADPKSDKINAVAPGLDTPYVGILDCDHQAHPSWVRSSIILMQEGGAPMIQGRREPISAHGFFPLWDSLHQHVGCEVFNRGFSRMGLTVFFTGSTALMETRLLKAHPLGACITEDTDFGYTVLLESERMLHNPYFGSDEETSPDLYSFLARRRRWSAGHTETFLRHLPQLAGSPLRPVERVQFLFHGVHYLVSAVVFTLHALIGAYFVTQLSPISAAAAALSSLLLAGMIGDSQRTPERSGRLVEVGVLFAWLFPAVVIALNLTQGALMRDFGRAVLPIPAVLQVVGLIGLAAPLVVLLAGLAGLRQLGPGSALAVAITWPVAFYLDLCGVLLGLSDYLTRKERWRPVARSEPPITVARDAALLPTQGIRASWGLRPVVASTRQTLAYGLPLMNKVARLLAVSSTLLVLFCAGVMYTPTIEIPVVPAACEVMAHDGDPWIVPAAELSGYCDPDPAVEAAPGHRTGSFELVRNDTFTKVDPKVWDKLDTTFFCNLSTFSPDNVVVGAEGGLSLVLESRPMGDKAVASGSIATKDEPDAHFTYGRFEAVLKPPKTSGVLTAFFLYRFDPWQEIDLEFLGRDPTKVLLNVYYNPGEDGDLYNYGFRGTPVLVDLGFDASEAFHTYAIEWERDEIRWFVDDRLIHVRQEGRPTPIPHLPMRVHVNTWPICSEELAGPFDPAALPARAEVKSVALSLWHPPPVNGVMSLIDGGDRDWRAGASWMQPGR